MSLDDDLAAWAAAARLPAAAADAIFGRIVAAPRPVQAGPAAGSATVPARHVLATTASGLDGAWWRRHAAGFAAGLVTATAPVRVAA